MNEKLIIILLLCSGSPRFHSKFQHAGSQNAELFLAAAGVAVADASAAFAVAASARAASAVVAAAGVYATAFVDLTHY